jgi:hypothetical protein
MGSSSGSSDFEPENTAPPPPASMISPQGQSTQYQPHFINFLGDTNTPSTGLTPDMLAAINASNGPPQAAQPTNGYDQQINDLRSQLAAMQAAQKQPAPNTQMMQRGGNGSAGGRGMGGAGNGAGGRGGGGWGGH